MRLFLGLTLLAVLPAAGQPSKVRDAQWTEFEGVRIPVPPAEHPRLFLRSHDIPDLKRRMEHSVLKPVWDDMRASTAKSPQIAIEVDALGYLVSGNVELGKKAIADAVRVLESAKFDPKAQDVTRPIGRMLVTGSMVYDWCYRLLTPDHKARLLAQIKRLTSELECGYPPPHRGWVTGHGSEWMLQRDMLSAGIAIYDEFPEMYQLAAHRFFKYMAPARNWWYAGHAFHQGSSYAETRFSSDMYPLWIFDRMGAGNVFHPAQQFVPYQWIYMRRPDGQLLRSGDGQSRPPKLRSLLSSSYYGDGYVLADYLRQPGIDTMSQIFELLWRDPDLKPREISELPLARYMGFPYGWMVARTGWGEDAVIAEMKVNVYNFGNHQHADAGAFQIYHRGPLAIDSGNYRGYGSPHHANYHKRTIAHNTLLIYDPNEKFVWSNSRVLHNDGGQRLVNNWREAGTLDALLSGTFKTGEVLGHAFGPDRVQPAFAYLKGDITEAYSAKARQVRRSSVFLNLGGYVPAAMIVFDRIVSADPAHKKYWLLHSMEEPAIDGNTAALTLSERGWSGKLVNTTLLPDAPEIAKVGGPGKEYFVFGENFPSEITRGNPQDYELGAWRVEVSPSRTSSEDLFLNVMQVTDRKTEAVLPVEQIDAASYTGARVGDRAVLFSKTAEPSDRPVRFRLSGDRVKCLVADLAEGTWQVWRNGAVEHAALPVRAGEGVLYFETRGGVVELRR